MKTTKTFRLLAVLLALMLAFGAMPALAVEIDSGDYAAWTQSAVDDLYGRLMAAENYEDYIAIVETLNETARTAFFNALTEEQQAALEEHAIALTPASEPFEPIVRFTKVGPLLAAPTNGARMMRAAAQNGGSSGSDSGIVLNKTAVKVGDDYKITLEAYATGSSTTTVSTEPVDIVLVLDVSGSMDDPMSTSTEYRAVYEPDNEKIYYILRNGKYEKVQKRERFGGWYYGTWPGTTVYPKTSESDTNSGHVQFYERVTSSTKRIDSLKTAVNGFIDNVAIKSPDSSIAIVKFAGDKYDRVGNDTYQKGYYTYNYSQIVRNLTMVDTNGTAQLKSAVNALGPVGATAADYGMEHARTIVNNAANDSRKKVVIMFTDGEPNHSSGFSNTVANDAISASKDIKDTGATVYTIGIFSGANGNPVTSWNGVSDTNKYMHLVSSNYKNATSMTSTGNATYPDGGKSYFLSAGSHGDLMNIFEQISQEVGGSTIKLDSTSYIQDTVTPYFTMPAGTEDVKFFTMNCNGENSFDVATKTSAEGVTAEIEDNTLKVTGFDFSANWCGSHSGTYSGKKLIVEFTVKAEEGFIGGNDVPTNKGETDGMYNGEGTSVGSFTSPTVNVPIKNVTVTAQDKNVYLLGNLTADQLKDKAVVKVGDVTLDLNKATDADKPYGLEKWQTEYVDITVEVKDAAGNVVTGSIADLAGDTTYTITATVTPREKTPTSTQGETATEQTGTDTRNINVFKPELTFKDNTVDYKSSLVEYKYEDNDFVGEQWKHGETVANPATMIGNKPELTKTYTPTRGVDNNIVIATNYVPVQVTVAINGTSVTGDTTFVHQDCTDEACQWNTAKNAKDSSNPAFLLHVIKVVGDLTITKNGLNVGTYAGGVDQESAIFRVTGDKVDMTVVVNCAGNSSTGSVTIANLPAGTYTVEEVSGWTWRYTAEKATQTANVVGGSSDNKVEFTNTQTNNKWLGGDNYKNNVFAGSSTAAID